MKRKTDRVKTMTALAGHFTSLQFGKRKLDTDYLNNSIIIYLDNKEYLYNAMMNRRRKATAVADSVEHIERTRKEAEKEEKAGHVET